MSSAPPAAGSTDPPWPALLAEARARLSLFTEQGRAGPLLADDTIDLAQRLWTGARDASGQVPVEAAAAVADLYWRRSQARPRPPAEDDDLGSAIGIYVLIASADPDAVPAALRPQVTEASLLLAEPDPEPADEASWDLRDVDAAVQLLTQAGADADGAPLAQAVTRLRALLGSAPPGAVDAAGRPVESVLLSNLGIALRLQAVEAGDPAVLDEAVDLTRRALAVTAAGQPPDVGALHHNLAITLGTRFSFTGAAPDLREAVAVSQRAVDLTDPGDPQWPSLASSLSGLLRVRYAATGSQDDLERSITLSQSAAEATPAADPGRGLHWSNVSSGLAARYDLRRDPDDLDASVRAGRRAVQAAPPEHPARGSIVATLANLLLARFEQFGELADIDESIRLGTEALAAAPAAGPDRAALQSNLGNAYRSRYDLLLNRADLRQDSTDLRQALELTEASVRFTGPGDPALPSRLSNRAMTLLTEYERMPVAAVIDEAVQLGQQAVAVAGSPDQLSKLLSNLSILLATRGESGSGAAAASDLEDAVTACESAVLVLRPDDPARATRLVNLAGTLLGRTRHGTGVAEAAQRLAAIRYYGQAAAVETAPVPVRMQAARSQADLAARLQAWPQALRGYTTAIRLLSRLVPRAITRPSREQLLTRTSQLAANSAASALQAGHPGQAIELLEQGRAVLWSQVLERSLTTDLAPAHPALAARFQEIALALS